MLLSGKVKENFNPTSEGGTRTVNTENQHRKYLRISKFTAYSRIQMIWDLMYGTRFSEADQNIKLPGIRASAWAQQAVYIWSSVKSLADMLQ